MRALVTGCAGFIGSHLTAALLDDGHAVVGVDALTANYSPVVKQRNLAGALGRPGFRFVRADLARDPVASLVAEADVVFHLAGEPGVRGSFGAATLRYVRANVVATRRLLAATGCGQRVVYASSSSVYGEAAVLPTPEDSSCAPRSPYAETKLAAERLCLDAWRRRGVDAVALRLFTVYGPRQRPDMAIARFIAAARDGTPLAVHGGGRQSRDFTYVGDVVEALLAAATAPAAGGLAMNIGAGEPTPLGAVIDGVGRLAGRPLDVHGAPEQPGDVTRTAADTALARERLGWTPRTSLPEGLAAQWEYAGAALAAA